MAMFAQYVTHLEKFGPELILETAIGDLGDKELGELDALITSKGRTHAWKRHKEGGACHPKRIRARPCSVCGLDLPRDYGPRRRRHDYCAQRAKRTARTAGVSERGQEAA